MPGLYRSVRNVRVRDVTMRDGLQSVTTTVATSAKLKIYDALVAAGITDLQVTSFVNPARLPQLADAEALYSSLASKPTRHSALVANLRGFERAVKASVKEVEAVVSVSQSYNEKNTHRTVERSSAEIAEMMKLSRVYGIKLTVGLANCYHCVFEGRIKPPSVFAMVGELVSLGINEICLCDTTGYATPDEVFDVSEHALTAFPGIRFGAHLHDTRGRGLSNAMAALAAGIDWFDAALAGLGGSPFAPGMGGNLSLETLVDALETMKISTGIDAKKVFALGDYVQQIISCSHEKDERRSS
jgi:hydroxymethylglutaryl-CoA lyase